MAWVTISPYPPRRGGCATVGLDGCGLELKRKAEPGYPRELLPREANLIRSTRASPSASLRIRSARPWSSQGPPRRAAPRRKARWRTCRVNPESASWASANEPSPSSRATRTLRRAHSRAAAPTPGLVPHTSHPPLDPCPRLRRLGTRGGWYCAHTSLRRPRGRPCGPTTRERCSRRSRVDRAPSLSRDPRRVSGAASCPGR